MSGLGKIAVWVLALGLLATPAFAQGGGGRRNGGPPPGDAGQRKPGPHFGDWLRKNLNTPPAQQQKALESDPKFQKLSPERQEKLKQRLQEFNALPTDQQQKILERMEKWEHMTPQQHQQARSLFDRMRPMPDERRKCYPAADACIQHDDARSAAEVYYSNSTTGSRPMNAT